MEDALRAFLNGVRDVAFSALSHSQGKRYSFERSPPCLVLHLLRFTYNRKSATLEKMRKTISFEKNLSIAEYPRVTALEYDKYELFAVGTRRGSDL